MPTVSERMDAIESKLDRVLSWIPSYRIEVGTPLSQAARQLNVSRSKLWRLGKQYPEIFKDEERPLAKGLYNVKEASRLLSYLRNDPALYRAKPRAKKCR